MCGRFVQTANTQELIERFIARAFAQFRARHNIAPGQPVTAIRENLETAGRECTALTWGLVPFWARDPKIAYQMTNARAETAAGKPAFRGPMRHKRCLIPADGFYEWQREDKGKTPYYIKPATNRSLALAGLWDHWGAPDGSEIESCTILTVAANQWMSGLHHRMPVLIEEKDYDRWLDTSLERSGDVADLLQPPPEDTLVRHPVSDLVNNARNDGPELIAEVPAEGPGPAQDSFFGELFEER